MTTTLPAATGLATRPAPRGTLLVADRIVTLGHGRTDARAVLVRGSRVVWVGDDPERAPEHGRRHDLSGCVLGPAFVDAHVHLTPTGLSLLGLDLSQVRSGEELLRAVASYAQQHTGRVIWGHGFDPHGFPDRLPGPDDLTRVASGRAVYLSRIDGHASLVDRGTLSAAPLARADGIENAEAGPTGVLRREANHVARSWAVGAMGAAELHAARRAATSRAAELGVGSVHEMGGPDLMGLADFDAWVDGRWPIEVVPYWGEMDVGVPVERDLRHVGGDLLLDGSLGAHTAALCEPYADDPGTCGHLELSDETLTDWFLQVARAGMQCGVHAIGDAALRQLVRCWWAVVEQLDEHGLDTVRRGRHRIEHAEVLPPDLLDDIARLGLCISAQPAFEELWGGAHGMYATRLGPGRAAWTNAYRAIADRGISLAFGSDTNVTRMDPWAAVRAAEQRVRHPEHQVSRMEAVSMSTLGGRSLARQDRFVGVVRAGMRADLAAFEGDPFEAETPGGNRCVLTLVQGRVAHGEAPLPEAPGR